MKSLSILLLALGFLACASTKKQALPLWNRIESTTLPLNRANLPASYLVYRLDAEQIRTRLLQVAKDSTTLLAFPNPEGALRDYRVTSSNTVSERLLEKYPNLAAYKGVDVADESATVRFEIPESGLQLMGRSSDGTWFISPFPADSAYVMVYFKKDLLRENKFWEGRIN